MTSACQVPEGVWEREQNSGQEEKVENSKGGLGRGGPGRLEGKGKPKFNLSKLKMKHQGTWPSSQSPDSLPLWSTVLLGSHQSPKVRRLMSRPDSGDPPSLSETPALHF